MRNKPTAKAFRHRPGIRDAMVQRLVGGFVEIQEKSFRDG
jgi:hypothetical protein